MGIKKKFPLISKIIIVAIGLFFIKNITMFAMNQLEIRRLKSELASEKKINLTLINEIKVIKTDSFVIRYAVDNLNLRPAEEDLVDLTITDEELKDIKLRIDSGIFGKKFEDIPTPSNSKNSSESDNLKNDTDNNENINDEQNLDFENTSSDL